MFALHTVCVCACVCAPTVLHTGEREGVVTLYRDVNQKPSENRSKVTGCHSLFHSTDFTDESVFSTDWTVYLSPLDQTVCIIQLFFMNMDLHMCNLGKNKRSRKGLIICTFKINPQCDISLFPPDISFSLVWTC